MARIFFWPLPFGDLVVQALALGGQVERLEALLDGLGAHVGLEVHAEAVLQLVEDRVLGLEVADLEGAEVLPDALELGDLLVERTCGPGPSPSRRRPWRLRFWSLLAPSASSAARSSSSLVMTLGDAGVALAPSVLISRRSSFSRPGMSW